MFLWRSWRALRLALRHYRLMRWTFSVTPPTTPSVFLSSAWRSAIAPPAAMLKGSTMAAFGLWVVGMTFWHAWHGTLPQAFTMGAIRCRRVVCQFLSFGLLWAYRDGDANMRSAWVCTRNDVLGNLAAFGRYWRIWHGYRLA